MERFSQRHVLLICVLLVLNVEESFQRVWVTTEDLENFINPEDLLQIMNMQPNISATKEEKISQYADAVGTTTELPVPAYVDCFGLSSLSRQILSIFMRPGSSEDINTHFYFVSRNKPNRVQVYPGEQFGLEWVDFKPSRKTVMIVHGFMSHSGASWINDMAQAFLTRADVNVIAVDWSGGGSTWMYWKAVANTRRVGSDIAGFMRQMIAATGVRTKDMHFIGHSLGAHIVAYASYHLGKVARITGLDPAQPCFRTNDTAERLDATDADFVDIIHTNGRLLASKGFGIAHRIGHADFYPNGGMVQPGCVEDTRYSWQKISSKIIELMLPNEMKRAICSHGRAYLLFTESLINSNCSFRSHKWNLTYEGVNASLTAACDRVDSCSEMGIRAIGMDRVPRAKGAYFALTTDKEPYCPTESERRPNPRPELLSDLKNGLDMDKQEKPTSNAPDYSIYADPLGKSLVLAAITTTTQRSWHWRWFG